MTRRTVSADYREIIIAKTLDGHSVLAISAMYQIKYQTVHSIVKKYLKTGIIIAVKRGRDRRTKIPIHVKNTLIFYVDEEPSHVERIGGVIEKILLISMCSKAL
ncbi:hypothetical protein CDIK_3118 [Cucumispora dikerogammari]|nr:hypothetical protein CDIK_3118 [Cucumispora dikerogammari]